MFISGRILILGAHPDDAELGMGATISKLTREMLSCDDIRVLTFAWKSYTGESLIEPHKRAMKTLGIKNYEMLNFEPTMGFFNRQDILDILYKEHKNDYSTVFTHNSYTSNQDHQVIFEETRRAFRDTAILGYSCPSSDYGFSSTPSYIRVSKQDALKKIRAAKEYTVYKKKPYMLPEAIMGTLRANGLEIFGKGLAERFEPIRVII